MISRLGFSR